MRYCLIQDHASGRTVYGVGLRPLACWDCGFESRRRHGCFSFVSVVCIQAEVSATGCSLVQSSPTECGVSGCDREALTVRKPGPPRGRRAEGKNLNLTSTAVLHILAWQWPINYRQFHLLRTRTHMYVHIYMYHTEATNTCECQKFAKVKTSVSTVGVFVELMSVSASELHCSSAGR
jgi:hypothetical protein